MPPSKLDLQKQKGIDTQRVGFRVQIEKWDLSASSRWAPSRHMCRLPLQWPGALAADSRAGNHPCVREWRESLQRHFWCCCWGLPWEPGYPALSELFKHKQLWHWCPQVILMDSQLLGKDSPRSCWSLRLWQPRWHKSSVFKHVNPALSWYVNIRSVSSSDWVPSKLLL